MDVVQMNRCVKCGAEWQEGQEVCATCGAVRGEHQKAFCVNCGGELVADVEHCPHCGHRVGTAPAVVTVNTAPVISPAVPVAETTVAQPVKKKNAAVIIVAIVAVLAIVAAVVITILATGGATSGGSKRSGNSDRDVSTANFNEMYPDLKDKKWCTIGSDGSYLKIDTNPDDVDTDDLSDSSLLYWYEEYVLPADEAIQQINTDLGFTDALVEKMNNTTWDHGMQSASNDTYTVTWTYHPDKGLEVMYEINNFQKSATKATQKRGESA